MMYRNVDILSVLFCILFIKCLFIAPILTEALILCVMGILVVFNSTFIAKQQVSEKDEMNKKLQTVLEDVEAAKASVMQLKMDKAIKRGLTNEEKTALRRY